MKNWLSLLFGCSLLIACGVSLKSIVATQEEADLAYTQGEYLKAAKLYEENLKSYRQLRLKGAEADRRNEVRASTAYRLGRIYHTIRNLRKAARWYRTALLRNHQVNEPLLYFYLAKVSQQLGKIEEAAEYYTKYAELHPKHKPTQNGLASLKIIQKWEDEQEDSEFKELKYERRLNTRDKDYALAVGDELGWELYLTSNREGTESEENNVYGELFTNLYVTKKNAKGKWSKLKPIDNKKLNTKFSDGTPSFTGDFNTMYYTHCEKRPNSENPCGIFTSSRSGETWSDPTEIKIRNSKGYSLGHPSINPSGDTLYFSSDMPGTWGGKDIWYVVKEDTAWSIPQNMGTAINTKMDEVFPYIRRHDRKFFFSSNGHLGLGGLDIFETEVDEKGQYKVHNLKAPLNSRADDFAIQFDQVERYYHTGYFSSNRRFNAKNDDIYSFARYPKEYVLRIYVLDAETFEPIEGARLKIAGSNGTDKTKLLTNPRGMVNIPLSEETKYIFAARKKDYLIDIGYNSTIGLEKDYDDIYDTLLLVSTKKPIVVPNILYKKNSYEFTPESIKSLEDIYQMMKKNPKIVVELRAHSDYSGSNALNMQLSQKRAETVVNFLVNKNIPRKRFVAVGRGENEPLLINSTLIEKYDFLKEQNEGKALDSAFIVSLDPDFQEVARELNRRTDLKVLKNE